MAAPSLTQSASQKKEDSQQMKGKARKEWKGLPRRSPAPRVTGRETDETLERAKKVFPAGESNPVRGCERAES
jgi:hypothetical protein